MRAVNLLIYMMVLAIVLMIIGMVGPAITGADKSPSYEPVLGLMTRLYKWATLAGEAANTPEENPDPFVDVVKDSAEEIRDRAKQQLGNEGESFSDALQGPMLSLCEESTDRAVDDTVPMTLADNIKSEYKDGTRWELPELREKLGQPHCSYNDGDSHRWLTSGYLTAIDLHGSRMIFTNF
jgi:hypothetical protein